MFSQEKQRREYGPDMIGEQIDAVFEDIEVDAVKVVMLSTPYCMNEVAEKQEDSSYNAIHFLDSVAL